MSSRFRPFLNILSVIAMGLALPAIAQVDEDAVTLAVVGGLLIDGNGGQPVADSVILIAGERISKVGTQSDTEIPPAVQVIDADGMTVMPGLIDLHVHYGIIGHADYSHWFPTYEDRVREEIQPIAAKIMLHAGVTSARDLGSDVEDIFWLREQISSGAIEGPRTFIAGPFLRDSRSPLVSDGYTWVIEGPEDGRRKVRRLVEMGVDLIKTQDDDLPFDELQAIYDEAHKLGMPVATHLFSQRALRTALEAGLGRRDTIEHIGDGHAPSYPADIVQMIVEQQVVMAPTIIAIEGVRQIWLNKELVDDPDWKRFIPEKIYEDIHDSYGNMSAHPLFPRAVYQREAKMSKLRQLYEAGARFVVATDSGTRANPHHMAAWREMFYLVEEVGLSPMEAIIAATKFGAEVLRREQDLGTIEEGKFADIIVIDGDPLMTMAAVGNVVNVIKNGDVVR